MKNNLGRIIFYIGVSLWLISIGWIIFCWLFLSSGSEITALYLFGVSLSIMVISNFYKSSDKKDISQESNSSKKWDIKRYEVAGLSIVDTVKSINIPYPNRTEKLNQLVCECRNIENATMVCDALNRMVEGEADPF